MAGGKIVHIQLHYLFHYLKFDVLLRKFLYLYRLLLLLPIIGMIRNGTYPSYGRTKADQISLTAYVVFVILADWGMAKR